MGGRGRAVAGHRRHGAGAGAGQLIPGTDANVVRPLAKQIGARYENVYLKTKVTAVEAGSDGLRVSFEGPVAPGSDVFDQVLVTVGRVPSGRLIGAEAAGLAVDDRGYIHAGKQQRTNVPPIFAIGDIVGQPMLARKATREGKVAAEVATGPPGSFGAKVIPRSPAPILKSPGPGSPRSGQQPRASSTARGPSRGRQRPVRVACPRRGHDQAAV